MFGALVRAEMRQLKRTSADIDAEPSVHLKARAKHAISASQAFALLLILGLIVEWLALSDSEKANNEQAKAEYQDAQDTVLEDMAGSIPESESNLAVVSRDGRVVRVNKLSGAWCVLIDNPSNPQSYFSCSEIDKRAQRVREQKSLASRIRHFLSIDLRTVLRNALVIITDKVRGNWRSERSISSRIAPPGGLPQRRVFCGMSAIDKMAGRKLDNRS